MDIEKIKLEIRENLSEKRYIHSIGVMERAIELAKIYGVDENEAMLVGIAHDVAKEMTDEEYLKYAEENNIELDDIERKNTKILHAKIGADICKKKYGFNERMQKAVLYHTKGSKDMDMLAKIIFIADETEKNRKFGDLEYLTNLSNTNIDEAILYILDNNIKEVINKGKYLHTDAVLARNAFLEKIENK